MAAILFFLVALALAESHMQILIDKQEEKIYSDFSKQNKCHRCMHALAGQE